MSEVDCSNCLRIGRIAGYPRYRVLSSGSIWSNASGSWKRRNLITDRHGYLKIGLGSGNQKRQHYVHKLVLEAFVGPRPDGMQCRHLDGNKLNNSLQNLRWGTSSENSSDARCHGTLSRGSRQSQAKLSESAVRDIRLRVKQSKPQSGVQGRLAREYGVCDAIISQIVHWKKWRHVT